VSRSKPYGPKVPGESSSGELAGLRRRRVDLLHRTITIEEAAVELAGGQVVFGPPKTEAGRRVVALPRELVEILKTHLDDHVGSDPEALVFTSPEGHPLRRTKFRCKWLEACKKAGISGLHFHDLRGSGATWAATAGATVRELMTRLGHTTPGVAPPLPARHRRAGPSDRRHPRSPSEGRRDEHYAHRRNSPNRPPTGLARAIDAR